jgi:hypothetical protein
MEQRKTRTDDSRPEYAEGTKLPEKVMAESKTSNYSTPDAKDPNATYGTSDKTDTRSKSSTTPQVKIS